MTGIRDWFLIPCLLAVLSGAVVLSAAELKPGVEGIWLGSFGGGGVELRIVFHINRQDDGSLSGTMDSIDQGTMGLELDSASFENGEITLEWKAGGFAYQGKLEEDGLHITGGFTQGGQSFDMNLAKVEKPPEVIRPQDPRKPYPYLEEEVTYQNRHDGVSLAATLTLPREGGPFPAVVLITGSGAQNRNEELLGHRPFLVLADHLTRKGIAVLRADDRGVGGTTGSTRDSTTEDFTRDALAGVEFLKSRPEIDASRIGLVGHSEGGLIAPLAASWSDDVAFIVMLAGTGLTGEEILYLQGALLARAEGVDESVVERSIRNQKKIFAVLKSGKDDEAIKADLTDLFESVYEELSDEEKQQITQNREAFLEGQFRQLLSPWFRFFLTYDPRPALRKVKVPVLVLIGEKDLQVPPKENMAAITAALEEGGNTHVTARVLPGLNHLFQPAGTGGVSEYSQIPITIDPSALETVSAWILETAAGIGRN